MSVENKNRRDGQLMGALALPAETQSNRFFSTLFILKEAIATKEFSRFLDILSNVHNSDGINQ